MLILFRDEEGLSFLLIGVVSGNLGTDTADCGSSQYPDFFSFIAHHNVSISCILSENPQSSYLQILNWILETVIKIRSEIGKVFVTLYV